MIQIYNTLTGKKEPFQTLVPGHVKLYVCGITSYDYCHIGHARSSLAFDMIVKYLKFRGYTVTFVRNFTDIDDKIIARANEQKISPEELANRFIDEFYLDMDRLGIDRPDLEPRATAHIDEMIDMIAQLVDQGKAYASGGDVYYQVSSFPDYGKLSKRNIEEMQAGARVQISEQKRDPMDFVLWKKSKPEEPKWTSPWGEGRPGWHIECSAMSKKYLGESFDIHGGGQDLIFPHHENEIAQSEGVHEKSFASTWIHHGFVTIRDEKMSKSLGNFLRVRDILEHCHPEVLRFFIFSKHYRSPLDFSESALQDAARGLFRLYDCLAASEQLSGEPVAAEEKSSIHNEDRKKLLALRDRFQEAMDNDFNTAQAQGIFLDTVKTINKMRTSLPRPLPETDLRLLGSTIKTLQELAQIMGLLREEPAVFLKDLQQKQLAASGYTEEKIEELIREREQCRAAKDWARSDQIRDQLLANNISLKDSPEGTTWEIRP